jgi:hypothetical protein
MTSSQERAIAAELVRELGPIPLEALAAANGEKVCEDFERVFDRHGIVIESDGARLMSRVWRLLAKAELNRQLAIRQKENT